MGTVRSRTTKSWGRVTIDEAEAAGILAIEGDHGAVVRFFDLLDAASLGSRTPAARPAAPASAASA